MANANHSHSETNDFFREFGMEVRVPLSVGLVVIMLWDIAAFRVILNTRRTPRNVRFLSSWLVAFDAAVLGCRILRNFVESYEIKEGFKLMGSTFVLMTYFTVAFMGVERNLMFCCYQLYLKYGKYEFVKKVAIRMWIVVFMFYPLTRLFTCQLMENTEKCLTVLKILWAALLPCFVTLSFGCYLHMAIVIRSKLRTVARVKDHTLKYNRGSKLTFTYLLTITLNLIGVCIDLIFKPQKRWTYFNFDIVVLINGMMDPILYIYWFKESRLVILRALSCIIPSMYVRLEHMRIDIYDIVTAVKRTDNAHKATI